MSRVPFDNTYAALPERFYARLDPAPVRNPRLIRVNRALCAQLGMDADWLASDEGVQVVSGNRVPEGAAPLAAAYAGHQFGQFNPQLGDGRAILLGEVVSRDGKRFDVQLKGSGRTPFSRGGDGRSPLGPVLREYIVSEAMAALGVPTTRALAATRTDDMVMREQGPLPGGVLVRVARSHIRVGTFEYFAARNDTDALQDLVDHVVERHYPDARQAERPALELLRRVAERQAALIAQWQLLGFIHGVMNTDNMLVSGETIDYGPCAFMDAFDPATVYSFIDRGGRYAYRNQPAIAQWNVACLARALLALVGADDATVEVAQGIIDDFPAQYESAFEAGFARKLGLAQIQDGDRELFDALLETMQGQGADFTLTFRHLSDLAGEQLPADGRDDSDPVAELLPQRGALDGWLERWRQRLERDPTPADERLRMMRAANPALIARNHLVDAALRAAIERQDLQPFHQLVDALADPHTYRHDLADLARPPRPEQEVQHTFCGT